MPDYPNDFLSSYFFGLKNAQELKQKATENQLANQKFSAEQAYRAQEIKQKADEFQQSMTQRQQEHADAVKAQQALFGEQHAARVDASQARFEDKGGMMIPTPQDMPLAMGTAAPMQVNPAAVLMPRSPNQPVGPQPTMAQAQSADPIGSLPVGSQPQIPVEMTLGADAQRPDPSRYQRVPGPLGMAAAQEAYLPTLKGKVLEQKEAENESNQMEWTPELAKALPEYGIEPGAMVDQRKLPLIEKHIDFMAAQAQHASEFAQTLAQREQAQQDSKFLKMLALQVAASKKENGGLSEELVDAHHGSVMDNPDSFHEFTPKGKEAEVVELRKETAIDANTGKEVKGLPAPIKLNPTQNDQEQYARRARTSISNVREILADPTMLALIKRRSGAILGRVGDLEQDIGATNGLSPEQSRKIQDFRSSIRYLVFQEGKALFGSRIPIQLMKELQSTSPRTTQSIDMLKGSLDAVNRNAENTLISDEATRFGGKLRKDFYARNGITGRMGTKEVESSVVPAEKAVGMEDGVVKHAVVGGADRSFVKRGGKVFEIVDK